MMIAAVISKLLLSKFSAGSSNIKTECLLIHRLWNGIKIQKIISTRIYCRNGNALNFAFVASNARTLLMNESQAKKYRALKLHNRLLLSVTLSQTYGNFTRSSVVNTQKPDKIGIFCNDAGKYTDNSTIDKLMLCTGQFNSLLTFTLRKITSRK